MLEAWARAGRAGPRDRDRVRLGTLVSGVTYRNPALLAKMATTLDVISGGRAVFGLGAAWFEAEHEGFGFDFPPIGERMDRLDEALTIVRAMFARRARDVRRPPLPHRRRAQRPAAGPARRTADPRRRRRGAADAPHRGPARGHDALVPARARGARAQDGAARRVLRGDRARPGRGRADDGRAGAGGRDRGRTPARCGSGCRRSGGRSVVHGTPGAGGRRPAPVPRRRLHRASPSTTTCTGRPEQIAVLGELLRLVERALPVPRRPGRRDRRALAPRHGACRHGPRAPRWTIVRASLPPRERSSDGRGHLARRTPDLRPRAAHPLRGAQAPRRGEEDRRARAAASAASSSAPRRRTWSSRPASGGSSRSGTWPAPRTTSTTGRACTRSRPARADVRSVTFLGQDFPVVPSGKGPAAFALEVLEHCTEDVRDELFVDGVTGLRDGQRARADRRASARRSRTRPRSPPTRRWSSRPEQRASAIVRQLLAKLHAAAPGGHRVRGVARGRGARAVLPADLGVRVPPAGEGQAGRRRGRRAHRARRGRRPRSG